MTKEQLQDALDAALAENETLKADAATAAADLQKAYDEAHALKTAAAEYAAEVETLKAAALADSERLATLRADREALEKLLNEATAAAPSQPTSALAESDPPLSECPPEPAQNPALGDKDPEWQAWLKEYQPNRFAARFPNK